MSEPDTTAVVQLVGAEDNKKLISGSSVQEPAPVESTTTTTTVSPSDNSSTTTTTNGEEGDHIFAQPLLPPTFLPPPQSTPKSPSLPPPKKPSPESLLILDRQKEEKYQQIISSLKYSPPTHAAPCADLRYTFEVLKNGQIMDTLKFSPFDRKGYYIIGRVPGCDILAENPAVSRMHAILQFIQNPKSPKNSPECSDDPVDTGLYLYDLKSTHGTFLNKNQLFPGKFYRVRVGHILKFGSSQRMYILNGPGEDEEEEDEKTVTELQNERLERELMRKRMEEEDKLKRGIPQSGGGKLPSENIEEEGINWGMGEDADEETDLRVNPFASVGDGEGMGVELNLDNPKKTLKSWGEREGVEVEYEMREKGVGQYVCRVGLPLSGGAQGDGLVYAESEVKGKKKEAAWDCAMKACQILEGYGVLRGGGEREGARKRKEKKWEEEDYYSSDEDTYLDRTGSIERKREKRMRMVGKIGGGDGGDGGKGGGGEALTFEKLSEDFGRLEREIGELEGKIKEGERVKGKEEVEDIDDYMEMLTSGVLEVKKWRGRLKEKREEIGRVKRLMEIARPVDLPAYLKGGGGAQEQKKDKLLEGKSKSPPVQSSEEVHPEKVEETKEPAMSPPKVSPIKKGMMVGPRKPPVKVAPPPPPPEPKRFGLITPENFAILKKEKGEGMRVPPVKVVEEEEEMEEEEDDLDEKLERGDEGEDGGGDGVDEEDAVPEFEKQGEGEGGSGLIKKKRQRIRRKWQQGGDKGKGGGGGGLGGVDEEKFSEWLPPTGQSGDGRTSLNDKLGY